jgi:hypothetical protein
MRPNWSHSIYPLIFVNVLSIIAVLSSALLTPKLKSRSS